jgi:hypothetical protein
MKYLAKWKSGGTSEVSLLNEDFFTEDNGYSQEDFKRITLLRIEDTIDLSDGISQLHTIERVL